MPRALMSSYFNPRSPHGERPVEFPGGEIRQIDFNPRSPHGERRDGFRHDRRRVQISIHAPRTGSDFTASGFSRTNGAFQSTLPARGATTIPRSAGFPAPDFNPRSPHGERRFRSADRRRPRYFNPRSPHGERRGYAMRTYAQHSYFNPRSPHGERQGQRSAAVLVPRISIHAPRTGSDGGKMGGLRLLGISIHAPRTGSDTRWRTPPAAGRNFNPRSPHGERQRGFAVLTEGESISIHAPRTGSDQHTAHHRKSH